MCPDPSDHPDTWLDFLKRHAATMWQCDFASKRKWTIKGMVDLYFLVFIPMETRRIWVLPCTAPNVLRLCIPVLGLLDSPVDNLEGAGSEAVVGRNVLAKKDLKQI